MRAKIAGDGFAAMVGRRLDTRRRTVDGGAGDEVPEAILPVLQRAEVGAETQGVTGSGAARHPLRTRVLAGVAVRC